MKAPVTAKPRGPTEIRAKIRVFDLCKWDGEGLFYLVSILILSALIFTSNTII